MHRQIFKQNYDFEGNITKYVTNNQLSQHVLFNKA